MKKQFYEQWCHSVLVSMHCLLPAPWTCFFLKVLAREAEKKSSVGLLGKSRTVGLRCRGGHNSKNRGWIATLGNRNHQSLSSVSNNFCSHKAFKMKSRCLLTGLRLPWLLLSCLFPKRPMGRTPRPTYQKGSISGPGIQSSQWGCTTALGGSVSWTPWGC